MEYGLFGRYWGINKMLVDTNKFAVPNWFSKKDCECFLGKEITEDQFWFIIDQTENLADSVSEMFSEWLGEIENEIFETEDLT